jgi:glycosyltransferase involved in cell wall biosynthesis
MKIDDMHFVSLGYVSHERMKVLAYSAADLFVHPAPVDNLPNVVMEAIACGTPVVGFPIGGVPDMVRPGVTGWLANQVSHTALATALNRALDDLHNGIDLRASCRETAVSEYGGDVQASQYSEVFATLLQNKATAVAASNR